MERCGPNEVSCEAMMVSGTMPTWTHKNLSTLRQAAARCAIASVATDGWHTDQQHTARTATCADMLRGEDRAAASVRLLLGVHSHHQYRGSVASVAAVRAAFGNPPTALVALPCCHEFHPAADVGRPPDHEHDDEAIFSEKRRVLVWRWPSGAAPLCNKSKIGSK